MSSVDLFKARRALVDTTTTQPSSSTPRNTSRNFTTAKTTATMKFIMLAMAMGASAAAVSSEQPRYTTITVDGTPVASQLLPTTAPSDPVCGSVYPKGSKDKVLELFGGGKNCLPIPSHGLDGSPLTSADFTVEKASVCDYCDLFK
jgi:hypothetical protein